MRTCRRRRKSKKWRRKETIVPVRRFTLTPTGITFAASTTNFLYQEYIFVIYGVYYISLFIDTPTVAL